MFYDCAIGREDMEKVNIVFHDNDTVSYQHKKVLQFVPEMSLDKNLRIVTPNIPLLVSAQRVRLLGAPVHPKPIHFADAVQPNEEPRLLRDAQHCADAVADQLQAVRFADRRRPGVRLR